MAGKRAKRGEAKLKGDIMTGNNISRRKFLGRSIYAGMALSVPLASCHLQTPKQSTGKPKGKPNFIVILSDDQGYADVGCYGAKGFKTPVLDKMAKEGARFTSFYAAPWCSPSRASFMTGSHYQRVGVTCPINRPEIGLHGDEITIAEHLKAAGYATAVIGKWHLGLHESFSPIAQGFDYFSGIPLSHIRHGRTEHTDGPRAYYRRQWRTMVPGREDVVEFDPDDTLFTQRITDESLDFIRANRDKPFFLFMSHAQVHHEVLASEDFKGKSNKGVWGDSIQELDFSVGEVLETLRNLGIEDDTLVIYLSDNGPTHPDGSAKPLSGRKGNTLEGGLRVPCIMRWPGKIPEGIICDETASIMDIFPTFARLIGTDMPTDRVIDGKDIWQLMTEPCAKTPHQAYYYYRGNYGKFQTGDDSSATLTGVRWCKWKLHLGKNGKWSLYDLETDVGESIDRSRQHPQVRRRLEKLLEKARADLGDKGTRGAGARPLGKVSETEGQRISRKYRGLISGGTILSTGLVTPVMTDEKPAAGRRVRQVAPEYKGTDVYHSLYLPVGWKVGGKYPVIVEYTGNKFPPGKGPGEVKDANLGYGMSGGGGFIWVCMPYVEKGRKENAVKWWGDRQATVDYCKVNLPRICKEFGGDADNVFICGFSRGAIGSSYIGLADDEIASLWKGMFTHDHFDGQKKWGYPESDRKSALKRLGRLKGRPVLVCGGAGDYLKDHLDLARFTFLDVPVAKIFNIPEGKVIHPHTDMWMHRESKYRKQARAWLKNVLKEEKRN